MIVPLERLLDRLRHPRSRADELGVLRGRLRALPEPADAPPAVRALALEMRRVRVQLSEALAGVEACGGCARAHPLPFGRWDGGHCCGGSTAAIFGDDELAALRFGGTGPEQLVPPSSDHAGCAFRGGAGCSLSPADRPTLCVRFICSELDRELAQHAASRARIRALAGELARLSRRFSQLRQTSQDAALPDRA